jgi:hypothetical protein
MAANPGTMRAEALHFSALTGRVAGAANTAAGVWSAKVEIPVGAVLVDILISNVIAWTSGTSATMIVGDVTDPNGYFAAVDLKTALGDATGLSLAFPLAKQGADITPNIATSVGVFKRQKLAAQATTSSHGPGREMSAEITTVGTTTVGETTVTFVYAYPAPIAATFLAT